MIINYTKLYKNAVVPKKGSEKASGFDLYAFDVKRLSQLDETTKEDFKYITLNPMERVLVKTGIALELPENTEAQIRPRSGLALKNGITVLNTPGTVDNDFREEVGVILINLSNSPFIINKGDRIAQVVFPAVDLSVEIKEIKETTKTKRGSKGYGSTGK